MSSHEPEPGGEDSPGSLRPKSDAKPSVNVTKHAKRLREERRPTPTDRIEARADRHILDLQSDRKRLQGEIHRLRTLEIAHLREDLRWLEEHASSRSQAYARLKASFEYAVTFSWFSSALVTLGGAAVSLAAILPLSLGPQRLVAAVGFAGLSVGVAMQGVNSYRGTEVLRETPSSAFPGRPHPNPDHGSDRS